MEKIKTILASSQDGVRVKLRIKAFILALFPLASALLRQFFGWEILQTEWVLFSEWIAYGVAGVLEIIGWWRAR